MTKARASEDVGQDDASQRPGNPRMEKPHDLEERTAQFGEAIIGFAKKIPFSSVTKRLISNS